MAENDKPDWRELCRAAVQENDPEKLLQLARQINEALSETDGHEAWTDSECA